MDTSIPSKFSGNVYSTPMRAWSLCRMWDVYGDRIVPLYRQLSVRDDAFYFSEAEKIIVFLACWVHYYYIQIG